MHYCSIWHWWRLTSSGALLAVCKLTCSRTLRGKLCDTWMHVSGGLFLWEGKAFPAFRYPGVLLTWMDVKPHSCDLQPSHSMRILAPDLQKLGLYCQFSRDNTPYPSQSWDSTSFAAVWMISFLGHTWIVHSVLQASWSLGEALQPNSSLSWAGLSSFFSPCGTTQWSLRSDLIRCCCQLLWYCPSPLGVVFVFTVFDGPDNYLSFLSILVIHWRDFFFCFIQHFWLLWHRFSRCLIHTSS